MAKMVEKTCKCGKLFLARQSDLNRGWGLSCSKSCAKNTPAPAILTRRSSPPTTEKCSDCGDDDVFIGVDGLCDNCAWINTPQEGGDDHKTE